MKRILSVALSILLLLCCTIGVFAAELNNPDIPRVVDNADVLTAAEEEILEDLAKQIFDKYGMDFVVYTDVDARGKNVEAGAEDFYDENGYGSSDDFSGSILYICFDPDVRSWYTSACGKSMDYFDNDSVNIIDDAMEPYMLEGDFARAIMVHADYVDELYEKGSLHSEEDHKVYDGEGGYREYKEQPVKGDIVSGVKEVFPVTLGFALVIGLMAGLVGRKKALASMHTVANASRADAYDVPGGFKLTRAENIFLTMSIHRVPKAQPQNNNNSGSGGIHSGGSSFHASHMSSGGHMHSGGGGRHF